MLSLYTSADSPKEAGGAVVAAINSFQTGTGPLPVV